MHFRSFLSSLSALAALTLPVPAQDYGAVFDEHWQRLDDEYPFFDRYGVDWNAEREEHRPRAVAAKNDTEFTWEMARMISCVRDSHTAFLPSPNVMKGWSFPDVRSAKLGGRTRGAEAAVHRFVASDGSSIMFSAWPLGDRGARSFQDDGVELDHALPLTIADVRQHGFEKALERVRRARYSKALEVLGAPTQGLDELIELATVEELETQSD